MTDAAVPDDAISPLRRLEQARHDLAERRVVHEQLLAARIEFERSQAQRRTLEDKLNQERSDVERLESPSATRLWSSLKGSRADDLAREQAEATEAETAFEQAAKQEGIKRDLIAGLERRAKALDNADHHYELALERVATATQNRDDDVLGPAQKAAEELARMRNRREVEQARTATRSTLTSLRSAYELLRSADNWSMFDTFGGGGLVGSAMKHRRLDDARRRLRTAAEQLQQLTTLLDGLSITPVALPEFQGLLRGGDLWFDNIFSDLTVFSEIKRARRNLDRAITGVEQLAASLERQRGELAPHPPS